MVLILNMKEREDGGGFEQQSDKPDLHIKKTAAGVLDLLCFQFCYWTCSWCDTKSLKELDPKGNSWAGVNRPDKNDKRVAGSLEDSDQGSALMQGREWEVRKKYPPGTECQESGR